MTDSISKDWLKAEFLALHKRLEDNEKSINRRIDDKVSRARETN